MSWQGCSRDGRIGETQAASPPESHPSFHSASVSEAPVSKGCQPPRVSSPPTCGQGANRCGSHEAKPGILCSGLQGSGDSPGVLQNPTRAPSFGDTQTMPRKEMVMVARQLLQNPHQQPRRQLTASSCAGSETGSIQAHRRAF